MGIAEMITPKFGNGNEIMKDGWNEEITIWRHECSLGAHFYYTEDPGYLPHHGPFLSVYTNAKHACGRRGMFLNIGHRLNLAYGMDSEFYGIIHGRRLLSLVFTCQ
jgi:hypothetical protein